MQTLLQHGAKPTTNASACLKAAAGGASGSDPQRAALCKLLIKHGADATVRNSEALVEAAKLGRSQTCAVLVEAGADTGSVMSQALEHASTVINSFHSVMSIQNMLYSNTLKEKDARMVCKSMVNALGVIKEAAEHAAEVAAGPAPWQPRAKSSVPAQGGAGPSKAQPSKPKGEAQRSKAESVQDRAGKAKRKQARHI